MTRTALAIDIGGTKIAAGVVTDAGEVLVRAETPTPARLGPDSIVAEAIRLGMSVLGMPVPGDSVPGTVRIDAVGVGSAGVIDDHGRVVSATDILTDWAGTDLRARIGEAFGVPVLVVNDAHAHAVGEAVRGAGRGHETVLLVAVGTGIGGAVVVSGSPLVGAHGAAGHLGHLPTAAASGLVCSCGREGHLEPLSSGTGLPLLYRRLGGDAAVHDSREVVARVRNDPIAREAVSTAASALGGAIGGLVNTVDPGVVIISGGMQNAGAYWWECLRDGYHESVLPALDGTQLVPAVLSDDAALIGASSLAITHASVVAPAPDATDAPTITEEDER